MLKNTHLSMEDFFKKTLINHIIIYIFNFFFIKNTLKMNKKNNFEKIILIIKALNLKFKKFKKMILIIKILNLKFKKFKKIILIIKIVNLKLYTHR